MMMLRNIPLILSFTCACLADAAIADDAQPKQLPNPFFAFDNGTGGQQVPFDQQAKMLKELGYDGIAYSGTKGIPEMLKALDAQGLKMLSIYVGACVDPDKPPYDPGLKTAIEQLKGRDTQIWLPVAGGTPSSANLDDRAVAILREIADMAEKSGLRVAIYPHLGCYAQRVEDCLRLVKKVDRKNVGVCFNLCHFLKLDDEKNLELRLKEAMPCLFAVNINGADGGATKDMGWDRLIQTLDRGSYDVGGMLKTLKRLGYAGPVGLQGFAIPGDCRENLTRSMRKWRDLTAAAGENWPQFRGPAQDGSTDATGLPLTWSETENVKWKTVVHGRGWSSPVIWGDQIWITTATDDGREQYAVCVDRNSGKVLHDIHLFHNDTLQITNPLNSYASPTPVIEAGRVYAHFGVYGTACLDTAGGKVLWTRRDIYCDHFRGPGSSPVLVDDLLIFPMDGIDVQFVIALDRHSGKTVWKSKRSTDFGDLDGDFRKAYSTPLLLEYGGRRQLICTGAVETMSYDPATGKELWKVRHEGFSNTARPLLADGLVLINAGSGTQQIWAVRPDGAGNVTETHVAWKLSKGWPQKPSPAICGGLVYLISDGGVASCVEPKTGAVVWAKRLPGQYSASPIAAEGRIYCFSHEGPATVIAAGREYKELAVNNLDEGFMASPAVSGKAIFLRTKTHLYRIEK